MKHTQFRCYEVTALAITGSIALYVLFFVVPRERFSPQAAASETASPNTAMTVEKMNPVVEPHAPALKLGGKANEDVSQSGTSTTDNNVGQPVTTPDPSSTSNKPASESKTQTVSSTESPEASMSDQGSTAPHATNGEQPDPSPASDSQNASSDSAKKNESPASSSEAASPMSETEKGKLGEGNPPAQPTNANGTPNPNGTKRQPRDVSQVSQSNAANTKVIAPVVLKAPRAPLTPQEQQEVKRIQEKLKEQDVMIRLEIANERVAEKVGEYFQCESRLQVGTLPGTNTIRRVTPFGRFVSEQQTVPLYMIDVTDIRLASHAVRTEMKKNFPAQSVLDWKLILTDACAQRFYSEIEQRFGDTLQKGMAFDVRVTLGEGDQVCVSVYQASVTSK